MGNVNVQGVVPLEGPGLTFSSYSRYEGGEFSICNDVELNDHGALVARRRIAPVKNSATDVSNPAPTMTNYSSTPRFIGHRGSWPVSLDSTRTRLADVNWLDVSSFPANCSIFGYHYYNKTNYFVCWDIGGAPVVGDIRIYKHLQDVFPTSAVVDVFADYSTTTYSTVVSDVIHSPVTSIIHKERLWILFTDGSLYASKATDPTIFAPPNGAYFKIGGGVPKDMIGVGDTLYILTDSDVWALTYSSDPNGSDVSLKLVSGDTGGTNFCQYQGNIVFVNRNVLYSISNTGVTKVRELSAFVPLQVTSIKVVSFANYLVFLPNVQADSILRYGCTMFFLNMDTGFMHGNSFIDAPEVAPYPPALNGGYPRDITVCSDVDNFGSLSLFIATYSSGGGYLYFMDSRTPDRWRFSTSGDVPPYSKNNTYRYNYTYDVVRKYTDSTFPKAVFRYDLAIVAFCPDGNEHMVKKFRSLEVWGKYPYQGMQVSFQFDNAAWGNSIVLSETSLAGNANVKPPHPYRVGVNQRARSISVRFTMDPATAADPGSAPDVGNDFMITDLRFLWTYTQRLANKKDFTVGTI